MNFMFFVKTALTFNILLIGYGQAQLYEGSTCTLHDGSDGICRNADNCASIKEDLKHGRFQNIVICSFEGLNQIACCADERPTTTRNIPVTGPQRSGDFVFVNSPNDEETKDYGRKQTTRNTTPISNGFDRNVPRTTTETTKRPSTTTMRPTTTKRTITTQIPSWMNGILDEYSTSKPTTVNNNRIIQTTLKPARATTKNSFWDDWSVTDRTESSENNHNSVQTTTDMPDWMKLFITDHATTKSILKTLIHTTSQRPPIVTSATTSRTTSKTPETTIEVAKWMQDILNEHSSTTIRSISVNGNNSNHTASGGGDYHIGGGLNLNSLGPNSNDNDNEYSTTSNRQVPKNDSSPDALPKNRYNAGSKADAACDLYSTLPTASKLSWHILGGVPTSLGEFPWMAALGYFDEDNVIKFDCGGTLISDYYVLTAAHCAPTKRPPHMVRLGKVTLTTNDDDAVAVDVNISNIVRHPDYKSSTKKNDIALIRLANKIEFDENVRPACLRTDMNDILPNVELVITGWGSTSAQRTLRPSVLLKTNVTSMPLPACNRTMLDYNRQVNLRALSNGLSSSQCCAFDPAATNDACQGDSGGPLQFYPGESTISTVVGVVSFGVSCGLSLPSIYTRVAYYINWIEPIVWTN